ncbi:MAG: cell division protein FtsQ/DivIB [Steroidobacteraceae bacterium]
MLAFWKPRNRRQARGGTPPLLERIDWRAIGTTAAAVAGFALLATLLVVALDRPVRSILVVGEFQRVSPPEIETVLAGTVHGGLASVDLDAVRERIERIEWVDRAVVSRRWPDTLRVRVVEQVAAARWNEAGLLNSRGELFIRNARYVPPELPRLEGPDGREAEVARVYLESQGRLLESGLRLTGVSLDERGAWQLEIEGAVRVRLGRQDVDTRLERFITLAGPLVAKRLAEINYVDMRYTNGFSVGWNARPALAVAPQEAATPDG